MRAFVTILCSVVSLSGALAPRAQAQPHPHPPPQQQAAVHFDRGMALFKANNFSAALTEFEAAYKISSSWKVLIHIGVCQSRLVRYLRARTTLKRYLEQGGAAIAAAERAAVERELSAIDSMLARVTVKVTGGPATLEVDGRALGRSPLQAPLLLGPGKHVLRARREGYKQAELAVELTAGARREVRITLQRELAVLHIDSRPAGAGLSLDGREVGLTPWQDRLPAKTYRLELTLAGHRPGQARVVHDGKQVKQLTIDLVALPPPPTPRWYTRWYWWTAIGAAVTAAVVIPTVVVTSQPRYDHVIHAD